MLDISGCHPVKTMMLLCMGHAGTWYTSAPQCTAKKKQHNKIIQNQNNHQVCNLGLVLESSKNHHSKNMTWHIQGHK